MKLRIKAVISLALMTAFGFKWLTRPQFWCRELNRNGTYVRRAGRVPPLQQLRAFSHLRGLISNDFGAIRVKQDLSMITAIYMIKAFRFTWIIVRL
jgi:hypothetical protein